MPQIDALFETLLARGGSDLHLGIGYPPLVRMRGDLQPVRDRIVDAEEMQSLLFEILSSEQRSKLDGELDLDFAHGYRARARFRASYFYKSTGLAAVFRVIPQKVLSLSELAAPEVLWRLAERRSGLVLVTGPTGSGKSTTLAAMIDHINKARACHVLTVEDPVEFVHEPARAQITHREVGRDVPSFTHAMRSAGRENPDVILVGELRTNETMRLALQLASFGILIFATVHTNSAAGTIERIVNAFPAEEQPQVRGLLAESLAGIVAQQLVRTQDGNARVAAHEILLGSPAVASLVREGKTNQLPSLMQAGQALGMQTLDMALERLMIAGTIAPNVAMEKAQDREGFSRLVARFRPDLAESPV